MNARYNSRMLIFALTLGMTGLMLNAGPVSAQPVGGVSEPVDVSPEVDDIPQDRRVRQSVSGKVLALEVANDGRRLYAGTYSGVWRSDDAGATWRQLQRPQPASDTSSVPGALFVPTVLDLAVSPVEKDVVLAATGHDVRNPSRSKNGIYRSSDGGESWHLVHQFRCPGAPGPENATQVVFAPDDPKLAYAAGGCAVATSKDGGKTWRDQFLPSGGIAWHVAVAPTKAEDTKAEDKEKTRRRVYALGDGQIHLSIDGGLHWVRDKTPVPTSRLDGVLTGGAPVGGRGNSSEVLVVEPGNPDHVFLVLPDIQNGPGYYFDQTKLPNGENCRKINVCGGGSLWLGDYSKFFPNQSSEFRELPGPPGYFGESTDSGRVYVVAKPTSRGYLLFFGEMSHVHVSDGLPTSNASWHRLDGRDASVSKREDDLSNKLFVHVDPMALAVSPDFDIRLRQVTDLDPPFNKNSELSGYLGGTVWMGNDGGVYRNTGTAARHLTWGLTSGLSTLQLASKLAGVALPGKPPALYFGVPDNDNFFSLNGGQTWSDSQTFDCGDCPGWVADPAQPDRVLEHKRPDPNAADFAGFALYRSRAAGAYPDPNQGLQDIKAPPYCGFFAPPCIGSDATKRGDRPLILTPAGEEPSTDGDLLLLLTRSSTARSLMRTRKMSSITSATDWLRPGPENDPNTKVFQQGPDLLPAMRDAFVVQASGGHERPVFYVGDPGRSNRVWRWTRGESTWTQIVPAPNGSATEARRFFADPYSRDLIYIIDRDGIKRSENGGRTWQVDTGLDRAATQNGSFSYDIRSVPIWVEDVAVINDMVFDRDNRGTRFAVGPAGALSTRDGERWVQILNTSALPGYPQTAYFDRISDPSQPALYVGMNGRGVLRVGMVPIPSGGAETGGGGTHAAAGALYALAGAACTAAAVVVVARRRRRSAWSAQRSTARTG